MKKPRFEIMVKPADEQLLAAIAKDCGLTLSQYIAELVEVKASEIRSQNPIEQAA